MGQNYEPEREAFRRGVSGVCQCIRDSMIILCMYELSKPEYRPGVVNTLGAMVVVTHLGVRMIDYIDRLLVSQQEERKNSSGVENKVLGG